MLRRLLTLVAVLVAAWLAACWFLFVRPAADTGAPAHADAIVMLSGDHRRLPSALALARRAVAPVLVLSVSRPTPWPRAESLCRKGRYASVRVLCFQAHPYSTRGEARHMAGLARAHGWRSLVVVSSTYHLTRARILFRRCWDGKLSFVGAGSDWRTLPYDWASETAKLLVQETVERGC
ncbi:MAG TPA: YdcF family protein [Gaiellaceae bacterium]|nr:YdcF family protein [Gaiellaceae bacterium]